MGKAIRVSKKRIDRKPGCLYYLGSDGYVWAVPMRGHKGSKHRVGNEKIKRLPGYLYYLGKDGYVYRVKR